MNNSNKLSTKRDMINFDKYDDFTSLNQSIKVFDIESRRNRCNASSRVCSNISLFYE